MPAAEEEVIRRPLGFVPVGPPPAPSRVVFRYCKEFHVNTCSRVVPAIALLSCLLGCVDFPPTGSVPVGGGSPTEDAALQVPPAPAAIDSIAWVVSVALRDSQFRHTLFLDLRDSRFPYHAIHLTSYALGRNQRLIEPIIERELGNGTWRRFALALATLPPLQLWIERSGDRRRWAGGADVAVAAFAVRPKERAMSRASATGHRPFDVPRHWLVGEAPPGVYMVVEPVVWRLPRDPEAARLTWPRQPRTVVSSAEEELVAATACDPGEPYCCDVTMEQCDIPGSGVESGGTALPSGFTWSYCTSGLTLSSDADGDQLRDDCEYRLAYAFRPMLAMNSSDDEPDNEPYFSVARQDQTASNPATIRIFYALSYFRDPGDPFFAIEAHDGDSEFIILEVHNTIDATWALDYVFLSAHWNAGSADNSARYHHTDVEYPSESRGRPRIWVSWNKHANYRSKAVCNDMWNDVCDNGATGTMYRDVLVVSEANLGNYFAWYPPRGTSQLRNCVQSRSRWWNGLSGTECYWTATEQMGFAGWHGTHGQAVAGPYALSLSSYAF